MGHRSWNYEASVASRWWSEQMPESQIEGRARVFSLILTEFYTQELNPEIETPSLRIALRIDAPCMPVRKMTMHIAANSVKVYSGFASDGPQIELIPNLEDEVQS